MGGDRNINIRTYLISSTFKYRTVFVTATSLHVVEFVSIPLQICERRTSICIRKKDKSITTETLNLEKPKTLEIACLLKTLSLRILFVVVFAICPAIGMVICVEII